MEIYFTRTLKVKYIAASTGEPVLIFIHCSLAFLPGSYGYFNWSV